jgi:hypothetical protein
MGTSPHFPVPRFLPPRFLHSAWLAQPFFSSSIQEGRSSPIKRVPHPLPCPLRKGWVQDSQFGTGSTSPSLSP